MKYLPRAGTAHESSQPALMITGDVPSPRRAVTAQEAAIHSLRDWLMTGRLAPGSRISQRDTADLLGCSIVPVREALKTLTAEGQVEYIPQRGFFVARLDLDELRETYRIREILESEAIRQAVPNIGAEQLAALTSLENSIRQASARADLTTMIQANRRLHFMLYESSSMPRLVNLVRIMWDLTDRYRIFYYRDAKNRTRVNAEHRRILKAVASGDVEESIRLLGEHRQRTIDSLYVTLAAQDGQEPVK